MAVDYTSVIAQLKTDLAAEKSESTCFWILFSAIQGMVADALSSAQDAGVAGPQLNRLVQVEALLRANDETLFQAFVLGTPSAGTGAAKNPPGASAAQNGPVTTIPQNGPNIPLGSETHQLHQNANMPTLQPGAATATSGPQEGQQASDKPGLTETGTGAPGNPVSNNAATAGVGDAANLAGGADGIVAVTTGTDGTGKPVTDENVGSGNVNELGGEGFSVHKEAPPPPPPPPPSAEDSKPGEEKPDQGKPDQGKPDEGKPDEGKPEDQHG